jgi:pimeloyl-ACP methyl ester carboxylesterase
MLAHSSSGSGPPLVLLHGIGLDRRCWDPVVPLLATSREVIAVDLPGFGETPPLDGEPSIGSLADAVAGLGLERPHVAGNSLGGAIALELGARGAAASVCALSPAGFARGARERAFERASLRATLTMARVLDPWADRLAASPLTRTPLMVQMFARPWRVPPASTAAALRSTARAPGFEPTMPALPAWEPREPTCAATVAWAERDRLLLTSRQAPRAARMLPRARHVILRGCGHVPMWDDPEQVARVLLEASARG